MTVFSVKDLSLELKFVKKLSRNCQVPVQLPVPSCPVLSCPVQLSLWTLPLSRGLLHMYITPHFSQTGPWDCHAFQLIRFRFPGIPGRTEAQGQASTRPATKAGAGAREGGGEENIPTRLAKR